MISNRKRVWYCDTCEQWFLRGDWWPQGARHFIKMRVRHASEGPVCPGRAKAVAEKDRPDLYAALRLGGSDALYEIAGPWG